MSEVSAVAAFVGGILSFFSPCILPLLPVYVSLISGVSVSEINERGAKIRILIYTLIFISGFSLVYLALGIGSSFLIRILHNYQDYLRVIAGGVLVIFGLLLLRVIKSGFFMRDIRVRLGIKRFGTPIGAFLVGFGFAAGWSPCIGPILGSILTYASISGDTIKTIKMLGIYCVGLAIPFLLSSIIVNTLTEYLKKFIKFFTLLNYLVGGLLIVLGLMMISGLVLSA
ncbi:MAG: cytochrome c biogenesis protein CcdA [Thermodesulfovibrionaceae bacterium]